MKRVGFGGVVLAAVLGALVVFPRWTGESTSLGRPAAATALPPTTESWPRTATTGPNGIRVAPPVDAARVLADPCSVITEDVRHRVGVDAEPDAEDGGRCAAKQGKRGIEVEVDEPVSADPNQTYDAFHKAYDDETDLVPGPWLVPMHREGSRTRLALITADVVVVLVLPVEGIDAELVDAVLRAVRPGGV
jgi:hypothetical protein